MEDSKALKHEFLQTESGINKLRGEVTDYFDSTSSSLKQTSDLHKEQALEFLNQVQKSSDAFCEIVDRLKSIKADIGDLSQLAKKTGKLREICERLAQKHEIEMN